MKTLAICNEWDIAHRLEVNLRKEGHQILSPRTDLQPHLVGAITGSDEVIIRGWIEGGAGS